MKRTLLALLLCIACGDDATPLDASPTIDAALTDSGVQADASRDSGTDAAVNDAGTDATASDVGITDASMADVQPDAFDAGPPVDDTIYFEVLAEFSAEEWVRGVALTHPITLSSQLDLVELRAARDFPGVIELRERDGGARRLGLSSTAFVDFAPLETGEYDLFVEYFGSTSPIATEHFTAQVTTPPRPNPGYAAVIGTVAQVVASIDNRNYDESRFTVRPGHRYVAHGIAGLTTTLIIEEEDVAVLIAGDPVTPLHRWGGTGDGLSPEPMYLNLPPGRYSLFAVNQDTQTRNVVVSVDEWELR